MIQATDLQEAYLFQELPAGDLETIAHAAHEITCEPDALIYKTGEPGRDFYVIAEGKVELLKEEHGVIAHVYGHIRSGGHFGEVSLITGNPRSFTARALTRTRLICFDRQSFENIILANPILFRTLVQALANRLVVSSKGNPDFGNTFEPEPTTIQNELVDGVRGKPRSKNQIIEAIGEEYDFLEHVELTRKIHQQILRFARDNHPLLITGELGTGKLLTARQIHMHSDRKSAPYTELDIEKTSAHEWDAKLFGFAKSTFPYSTGRELGLFEQYRNGTVVFYHAEKLGKDIQKKLYDAVIRKTFTTIDGKDEQPFRVRLVFIVDHDISTLKHHDIFIPEWIDLLASHVFSLPPLREHRRDIPLLVNHYLRLYSAECNKRVSRISPDALGILMKYDWPGNLTELSSVIYRAVMVTQQDEIVSEQILLGLPRTEGKLQYNLLRIPLIRRLMESRLYPVLPRAIVGVVFCIGMLTLFFGSTSPEENFGLTLSWHIGWPLLIISFFFLPRFWCSICPLSLPGKLVQKFIHPERRLPVFLINHSEWIMAFLCIVVFWVEIVWNASHNPFLTGMILLSISLGALIFSMFFQRYSWCRYLCPLGRLNAIFSMPSTLELRANREVCENQCTDHTCYRGTDNTPGCPMFRHPFLVDNNKDCILCGNCIKNCRYRSIQLNLRMAPSELWSIQSPVLADNFLVVCLAMIYFFLARQEDFLEIVQQWSVDAASGWIRAIIGSISFWAPLLIAWYAYSLICLFQSRLISEDYQKVRITSGYGMIPLVIGGYLAFYMKMFFQEAWRLIPNFLLLFGIETIPEKFRIFTTGAIPTVLHISILGGTIASLYATYQIFKRMKLSSESSGPALEAKHLLVPFVAILSAGMAFLLAI
jgi:polyferredoxin